MAVVITVAAVTMAAADGMEAVVMAVTMVVMEAITVAMATMADTAIVVTMVITAITVALVMADTMEVMATTAAITRITIRAGKISGRLVSNLPVLHFSRYSLALSYENLQH